MGVGGDVSWDHRLEVGEVRALEGGGREENHQSLSRVDSPRLD